MNRPTLASDKIDQGISQVVISYHQKTVQEVIEAINSNQLVIVGMAQNPFVKKARNLLKNANLDFKYLEYGTYFSHWKPRLAIKMWSGWPTYPQIFIDGKLVGGASDLQKFLEKK